MLNATARACTILSILCALTSCEAGDSCSGGDNMSNPRIAGDFAAHAANPELHLLWDQGTGKGAALPASYFDLVRVSDVDNSKMLLASAEHSAARDILLRFNVAALATHLEGDAELSFRLEFPDRRSAITCAHPGMADAYFVVVTLKLHQGTITTSSIAQPVSFGAI